MQTSWKDSGTNVGTKMGSFVGNDQNTLLYDFMQKFGIKCEKICNAFRNFQMTCNARKTLWTALYAIELRTAVVKTCSWGTVENCRVKHSELKRYQR